MDSLDDLSSTLRDAKENDHLLRTIFDLAPANQEERKRFTERLAAIHNRGDIDLVAEFRKLRNDPDGPNFFLTRFIFEDALASLDSNSTDVAHCIAHLVSEAGTDLMAGTPLSVFRNYLDAEPTRPAEVLSAIKTDPVSLAPLLPTTAAAGFAAEREVFIQELVRLAKSRSDDLGRAAIVSLGSIELNEEEDAPEQIIQTLESLALVATEDGALAAIIAASTSLVLDTRPSAPRLQEVVRVALEKGGDWSLDAAARAFEFRSEKFGPSLIEVLVDYLKTVQLANTGTLTNVDFGISSLLKSPHREAALDLMDAILRRGSPEFELKRLASSMSAIHSSSELLSKVVTRWIASGEPALCTAAAQAVQHAAHNPLVLDAAPEEIVSKDDEILSFIARKALGYLFFWPVTAASFLLSLMRFGAVKSLTELLVNPLLLNYTGAVQDFLHERSKTETEPIKVAIEECLATIEEYLSNIRSAVGLRELRPSEAQRAAFHKSLSQKMSKSFEAAQAEMPLLSLVKRSIVLHGRGSVQHVLHEDGSSHRADMMFKTQGAEMVFPRMMQIDELGLHHQLRVFRVERRRK